MRYMRKLSNASEMGLDGLSVVGDKTRGTGSQSRESGAKVIKRKDGQKKLIGVEYHKYNFLWLKWPRG